MILWELLGWGTCSRKRVHRRIVVCAHALGFQLALVQSTGSAKVDLDPNSEHQLLKPWPLAWAPSHVKSSGQDPQMFPALLVSPVPW